MTIIIAMLSRISKVNKVFVSSLHTTGVQNGAGNSNPFEAHNFYSIYFDWITPELTLRPQLGAIGPIGLRPSLHVNVVIHLCDTACKRIYTGF
jgi:hypothetical protein